MRYHVFALSLLAALPLCSQHSDSDKGKKNPAIGNPEAIAKGAKLYGGSCAGCHGSDGSGGRGPNLVKRAAWHPLTEEGTFDTIRNGVPGADMPATKLSDDQTWNLVAFVQALTGPASETTVAGDPAEGEKVFWGSKAGCSNCHAIKGRGNRMAPDLSNIGGSQPLPLIRESVIHPSKQSSFNGKESVTVVMKNGTVVKGIARNRSNYDLQVVDEKGELHLIPMTDVKQVTVADHSAMPEDYATRLSRDEMQNLLAFLARQTTRSSQTASSQQTNR